MTFDSSRDAFVVAADWFVATVAQVGDRWAAEGLGEWDVRALVGHTSRSLLTVEAYLAKPAQSVEIETTAEYYRATREIQAGPDVAQRGRDAGLALGDDPVTAVTTIRDRVVPVVAAQQGSELVTTIVGGMRLSDYLPTRTFELVVHTADLARALGLVVEPPAEAALPALALIGELAVGDGRAGTLLLALTGRLDLPTGFSVL
ncbi:MAG TPA: maleylpyruvate isomerase N-terminal domain-containing protein [Nocardioidaceae bacterium]|nr:maleylpyruvate isomerase N-terminal domain-containing protein [Nocardioidaceae bacterium]